MTEGGRGLSIRGFAIGLVALTLVTLCAYAALGYSELLRVKSDLRATAAEQARAELDGVLQRRRVDARALAARIAAWEGTSKRIRRNHIESDPAVFRLPGLASVPDWVLATGLYDSDGRLRAETVPHALPRQLRPPVASESVALSPGRRVLSIATPVYDADDIPQGFVGVQASLVRMLRNADSFRYISPSSIRIAPVQGLAPTWENLPSAIRYELRDDPLFTALSGSLTSALFHLGTLVGGFMLLLLPALVVYLMRPLRAIADHIDRLADHPGHLLERPISVIPIAETEKIRAAINDYQGRLVDVQDNLDEASRQLWSMAQRDALSGVKNRRAFDEYLRTPPQSLGDFKSGVCFALFDIHQFKSVNDSYGHRVGDQVLQAVARRIGSVLRRGEELFRIGGDEFAVVLLDCNKRAALQIAERCQERVASYDFTTLGVREPLRVCAGLAHARICDLSELLTLQREAGAAMYRAKRPGNANIVMFDESMERDCAGLYCSWLNNAVYDAAVRGEGLIMHYQPIVDFESGKICHYEALLRIWHSKGLIPLTQIMPVVEARRLEVELDRAVMRQVLADLAAGKICTGTGISLNLSGPTLVHDQVCHWLGRFRPFLSDYRVMIEVTETALITQIGVANENLLRLREHGFDIALDDFGSGYSSVRYLASMPVDVVKFDISLVKGLHDDSQANMVKHLAQMILESGHHLVAEGIEDLDMLQAARAAGFARGQGYLLGRPAEQARLDRVVLAAPAVRGDLTA